MLDTLGEAVTVALAIVAVLIVPAAIIRAWWPEVKRAATNTIGAVVDLFLMSPQQEAPPRATDMEAVYIPVSHTSMDEQTTDDYAMPRIGRRLSDGEIVALLALQKGEDGARYRFSANEIAALMKGDRNTRLAEIRAIREGPPVPQVREHQARLVEIQREAALVEE